MITRRNICLFMVFIVVFIEALALTACSKPVDVPPAVEEEKAADEGEAVVSEEETTEGKDMVDGLVCPLCGEEVQEESLYERPVAVMLDNHSAARPQAGLDQADVVYEILAEGNITRYMAVYMHDNGEIVGPVRSARRYFIDKAMEHDAIYLHAGGSPEAWEDIASLKIPSLDAMSLGHPVYWRENHRKMPHNIYGNLSEARKMASNKGYRESTQAKVFSFNHEDMPPEGQQAAAVRILYPPDYRVSYRYSPEEGVYFRYVMDKPHTDENNKDLHLTAKNIIIQKAVHKVLDSEGRRRIDLVGKGEGMYISDGQYVPLTWKKDGRKDATEFYLENGEQLKLNPGKTWVQVIPMNASVSFE